MASAKHGSRAATVAALGLAFALGACASGGLVTVTNVYQASGFSLGHVQYGAARGKMFAEIRGNAFKAQSAGYEEEIASVLRLPSYFPPTPITTRPSEDTRTSQRLAFVFNPARPPGAALMCNDIDRVPLAPTGPVIHVQAAFCSGERGLAEAHAVGPAATGPEDPAFQDLMRQVMINLLGNPAASQVSFVRCMLPNCL